MLDLIFKSQKFGAIQNITIDATVTEQHVQNARVTRHFVEEGSSITDHIRPDPLLVTLHGYISNKPIIDVWNFNPLKSDAEQAIGAVGAAFNVPLNGILEGDFDDNTANGANIIPFIPGVGFAVSSLALASGPLDVLSNVTTATTFTFDREFDRAANAFEEFLKIIQEGQIVDIATSLKIYRDMVIESFNVDRDADSGDALIFTATASQIKIVSTDITESTLPKIPGGKAEKKTGKKTAPPSNSAKGAKGADRLSNSSSAANAVAGF